MRILILCVAAVIAMSTPAWSHHSFAMYDQTKPRVLTGRVTRYIPGSNHAQLLFVLLDNNGMTVMKDGKPEQWGFEGGSAAAMARQGVTRDTFAEGTIFTVRVSPLRDGRNFGALSGMLISCGTTMPKGGCNKDTGKTLIGEGFNAQ